MRIAVIGAEQHLAIVAADFLGGWRAPIESKRFLIVPELSSAARMPLPAATMRIGDVLNVRSSLDSHVGSPRAAMFVDSAAVAGRLPRSAPAQRLDAGERLAFQPLQERAAGGRDIAEIVGRRRRGSAPRRCRRRRRPTAACRRLRPLGDMTCRRQRSPGRTARISKAPSGPFHTSVRPCRPRR